MASSSSGSFTIMAADSTVWRGDSANVTMNSLHEYIASSVSATQSSGAVQESNLSNQHTGTCRACSFVTREEIGFVSQDFTAKTAYVSTQFPVDPTVASIVRSACMRSLSCEVLPGREGPVYFGDDVNGHVISYAFFIKDHSARGYQVKYSFLVISWDQIFLMNLWPFIVKNFECMASRLQRAGSRVYEDKMAAAGRSMTPPSRGSRTPPRVSLATTPPANFNVATSPPPMSMTGTPSASGYHRQQHQNPPLLSSQAIAAGNAVTGSQLGASCGGKSVGQRRATDSDMRSLADLTKDDQIFYRIHAWFTWLLRLAGRNWTVYPIVQGPICEDQQVEAEHREGQDDLFLPPSVTGGVFGSAGDQQTQQHLHRGDSGFGLLSATSAANSSAAAVLVSPLNLAIGQSLGWTDGSLEGEIDLQFRLLTRLFKCVGEDVFSRIVHHVTVGNQVIVLPLEDARLGSLTTAALARFLPRGCVHMVIDSPEYVPAFYCNLLSLTPDAFVSCGPGPPDPSYMLLQVSVYSPTLAHPRPEQVFGEADHDSSDGSTESDADVVLKSLHFVPTFGLSLQPSLATRQIGQRKTSTGCSTALDGSQSPSLVSPMPQPAPAWAATSARAASPPLPTPQNKSSLARQVVNLFRAEPPVPSSTLNLALAAIRQEWIDRARFFYSFKRCQGPALVNEDAAKRCASVLAALQCLTPEDEIIVRFWQKGLSQKTRQNVCHTHRSVHSSRRASGSSGTIGTSDISFAINALDTLHF